MSLLPEDPLVRWVIWLLVAVSIGAPLLARIESEYGVDRFVMLALWGVESSFGEVIDNPKYMRPVIPALAGTPTISQRRSAGRTRHLIRPM